MLKLCRFINWKRRITWYNVDAFYLCSYGDFLSYTRQKKNKTYILKPASGCQGKGIWITKNIKEIKPHEHMVCQQYLSRVSHIFLCCWMRLDIVQSDCLSNVNNNIQCIEPSSKLGNANVEDLRFGPNCRILCHRYAQTWLANWQLLYGQSGD